MKTSNKPSVLPKRFVIYGNPPSKKNTLRIWTVRGHPRIGPSAQYFQWERSALEQLKNQWSGPPIPRTVPINMTAYFYKKTKRICDLSNLYEGVQDVLQKAGVLENDSGIKGHDLSRIYYDKECPRTEVILWVIKDEYLTDM
jgi:Holliday junction resolvase RusA-like endonuclease